MGTTEAIAKATEQLAKTSGKIIDYFRDKVGLDASKRVSVAEAEARAIEMEATARNKAEIQTALTRVVCREIRRTNNLSDIVQLGNSLFPSDASLQLTEGFVNRFANAAEDVSEPDLQALWAKALAQEAQKEGSISPRTLEIMRQLSRRDAELIQKYSRYIFHIRNDICILNMSDEMVSFEQVYAEKMHLEDIGILVSRSDIVLQCYPEKETFIVKYFDKVRYANNPAKEKTVKIEAYPFTQSGMEIMDIVESSEYPHYFDTALSYLRRRGLIIAETPERVEAAIKKRRASSE